MRVGLIGCGQWGKNIARELDAMGVLSEVYDPAIPDSRSFDVCIGRSDAVVIAAPSETHADLARECLEYGRHVLVEKPMCLTVDEATSIESDRLMVGHLMLYHPAIEWLKSENLDIDYLTFRRTFGRQREHESAFDSLATHDVAIALHLLGETPCDIHATGHAYRGEQADVVYADLTFPSGRHAHIHASWLDPVKARTMTLVGRTMAVLDDTKPDHPLSVYATNGVYQPHLHGSPLRRELEHFVACSQSGEPYRSDWQQGLEVVKVLEGVRQCIQSKTPSSGRTPA